MCNPLPHNIEEVKSLSIGQQAPDFSSLTPEGKEVKLSDFRGPVRSFWIFGLPLVCAHSREEEP